MENFNEYKNNNNQNQPLISVVLPVYNVGNYINEALDSIFNQTIQDFEILIIDDCSTDNTLEVVHSYNDDRIVIITKEKNKGDLICELAILNSGSCIRICHGPTGHIQCGFR